MDTTSAWRVFSLVVAILIATEVASPKNYQIEDSYAARVRNCKGPSCTQAVAMREGVGDVFLDANPLLYQYDATKSMNDVMTICSTIMRKELQEVRAKERRDKDRGGTQAPASNNE